ncbi:MAG: ATP-binding protein [Leptospiraceae bacterium]|nr:ATP-binding protein [Leptospiraceae bacterium]MCP5497140.1 ATP-binding protein [Leptospiraceae bacterium]
MKPLPIGVQTFRKLINGGCIYVDKTKNIYDLIKDSFGIYFLSRPRRFGKSLLISTLEEIFLGNKELFRGLWIYDSEYQWKKYPVIRLDFSKQKATEPNALIEFINNQLNYIAENNSCVLNKKHYYERFEELIIKLSQEEKVVILIDEYDKPIIDHIEDTELAVKIREVMKGFFTILKGNDQHIRFLFLTGVSKFSKAGVFSNLNQLDDITLNNAYSTLLGITENELIDCFQEYISSIVSQEKDITTQEFIEKIRFWYNGYCFSSKGESVYNPFSTLKLFSMREFHHYWFETGTPEFLVKLMIRNQYDIMEIPLQAEELSFSSYEVDDLSLTPLLVQTGYLTIKDYDHDLMYYTLDYPNFEVKKAFITYFIQKFRKKELYGSLIIQLIKAIQADDIDKCMFVLREIFVGIDYDLHIPLEKYYQTLFYLVFTLLGFKIATEVKTNIGRIDAVVESKSVYIFEFKLNRTKEEALEQIKSKRYYEKYVSRGKPIYLVGVEFKDRNIGEYIIERLK